MRIRFLGHRVLFVCCFALLLCACASPDAQRGRATAPVYEPSLPGRVAQPAPYSAPLPAPPVAFEEQPSTPIATPLKEVPTVAANFGPHIAVILPLASRAFGTVAEAFKQGFAAAAAFEGRNALRYRVYVAENEGDSLAGTFRAAANNSAMLVVAGLSRDGATLLARIRLPGSALPILALNAPEASVSGSYYYVSLSLDNEARQAAQFAASEGARSVAVIFANSGLAARIQESFEKEWLRLGGEITARIPFGGDPNEAANIHARLENVRADVVFIAAEPAIARFARPYVPAGMPVYATSLSFDTRADAMANIDLDGVRFLDMPWFVQPDHPAVMIYPRPDGSWSVEQERLYALGVDAWRLAALILRPDQQHNPVLDGVTGRLTLDASHQFVRGLTPVEFRDGRAQLYKSSSE